jgi:hypothetical protein
MLSFSLMNILRSQIGTDAMASKFEKKRYCKEKIIERKHCSEKACQANARWSITKQAPTSEKE